MAPGWCSPAGIDCLDISDLVQARNGVHHPAFLSRPFREERARAGLHEGFGPRLFSPLLPAPTVPPEKLFTGSGLSLFSKGNLGAATLRESVRKEVLEEGFCKMKCWAWVLDRSCAYFPSSILIKLSWII
eukprot:gene25083-biopygen10393